MPVLVIEDSERDARQFEQLIDSAGFGCQKISGELLSSERITQESPSLIVIGRTSANANFGSLLSSLRDRFPAIPVVTLTDETLGEVSSSQDAKRDVLGIPAKDALQLPIAGCLPRRRIESGLVWTLRQILGSDVGQSSAGTENQASQVICYTIDNVPDLLPLVVAQVRRRLEGWSFSDSIDLVRVTVALSEALDNAMYHGNLELSSDLRQGDGRAWRDESLRRRSALPYCQRRIQFLATIGADTARFVIRDEGPGFDPSCLGDCTESHNLELCSGRGLLLMQMYMDDVDFNDAGNEVILVKHRPREQVEISSQN